ncbi:MAG TPA: glycerol-3-phosphate 1-O-acyltransferase PlsY [Bacillota bacterium]|nr:glycerol-3-phosphate 1-O-acyltransferase PlsY [Bacillota bacterium]
MQTFLVLVFAYLLGSISFGYLIAKKWAKIDIRKFGSGNIGMTNIWRVMGWPAAAAVFAGDMGKGMLAAWLGRYFGGDTLAMLAGFAVMAGHVYPVFLGFKGGKAVATGVGVVTAMSLQAVIIALAFWLVVVAFTRYVSLASVIAASSVPLVLLFERNPWPHLVFAVIGVTFVIYKHIPNMQRLLKGQEFKIGQKVGR